MYSRLVAVGIVLAAAVVAMPTAQAARLDGSIGKRIDEIANEHVQAGKTAGVVVEVMQDGRVLYTNGYGKANIENDVPMQPQSVLRVASVTKQFTAAALLILVERDQLSLDDRLSKFFADFPRGAEVTLRQLLNHTSGIHNYTEIAHHAAVAELDGFRRDVSSQDMLAFIQGFEPLYDFDPGAGFHYSNSNYYLAGMIIEKVSGQSYAEFLHENIFNKLGMSHTAVDNATDLVARRAAGYDVDRSRPGGFKSAEYLSMTITFAAGALRSTAHDLTTWHHALFAGKVIGQPLLAEMTSPGRLKDGRMSTEHQVPADPSETTLSFGYGMGLFIKDLNGSKRVGHDGNFWGFQSDLYTYPEQKLTIAVLCNTGNAGADELAAKIAAIVPKGGASSAGK